MFEFDLQSSCAMKATDDLHRLLHSLSQAEKRYVKIFASKHLIGEQNKYMRLFDAVLAMAEHNEEKLKKQIPSRHISSEKNYLYNFVLKSMRTFHSEKSVDKQLKEAMLDIRFLIEKRLYDLCDKELQRAKKLAYEYEKFTMLLEILFLERNTVLERTTKDIVIATDEINAEIGVVQEKFNEYTTRSQMRCQSFMRLRHKSYSKDEAHQDFFQRLAKHELFNRVPDQNSFELQYNYLITQQNYFQGIGSFDEAYSCQKELLALWDRFEHRKLEDGIMYQISLSNYLNACFNRGNFDSFAETLEAYKNLNCNSEEEEAEKFQNTYYMELLYCMNCDKMDYAISLLPEIEKGMKIYRTKINKARELAFYYNIGLLLFLKENFKASLEWINKIIQDGKTDARIDLQHLARLIQLVLFFETGKHDLLEYSYRSVKRLFNQQNASFGFEAFIFKCLRQLTDSRPSEYPEIFKELLDSLTSLREGSGSRLVGIEEFEIWARHRLENRPMRDFIHENAKASA